MNSALKRRWIILYYSFSIYVGMSGAIFGPSLLKLVEQTNSSLGEVSLIFPTRALSYMAGSWIAGFLFDRYSGHKILTWGLPFIALTLGLIPFLKSPQILILVSMIMALAIALVDVGCNSLLFMVPQKSLK